MNNTAAVQPGLSRQEIESFFENGYFGPFSICAPEEMTRIREQIKSEVLPTPGPWSETPDQLRHQDKRVVYELCAHPEVVGRINSLWGPDILIWRSNFFNKPPGGAAVQWHQDVNFWKLDPLVNLTAWLALSDVHEENSCVQLIPGSHQKIVPHVKAGPDSHFAEMADPAHVDEAKAVKMILKAGEVFVFNERILHYSAPNRSRESRKCLITRYSMPWVKIPPICPAHRMVMASGIDRFKFNAMAPAPLA